MKFLLFVFVLSLSLAYSPQVFADDLVDDYIDHLKFTPSATDGLGRMFSHSQALVQALDTLSWQIMFGTGGINAQVPNFIKTGPICFFDNKNTSSVCRVQITTAIFNDAFKRAKRRRFHQTLTHLSHIRGKAIKSIDSLGDYYSDKSWGSKHARCLVYSHFGDIKQDWPRYLSAFRADRRGLPSDDKEIIGLYFNYTKRIYGEYLKAMTRLEPDLRELCEEE